MKVGIVTIHQLNHYGTVLQAFALQWKLHSLGYDSEIIDYCYPNNYHTELNNKRIAPPKIPSLSTRIINKIKIVLCGRRMMKSTELRTMRFNLFNKENIRLSDVRYSSKEELHHTPPIYDLYLTGSDQVWNPYFMHGDTTYLLSFAPENVRRISYAASFGRNCMTDEYSNLYAKQLSKYESISVREKSGINIVRELTGKDATLVLDPTLLLNSCEWNSFSSKSIINEPYILCYILDYAFNPSPYIYDLAEQISNESGYKLVQIDRDNNNTPKHFKSIPVNSAGPAEFLSLFRHASLIITTSFHGTAFAVNFNKPLLSVINDEITVDCRQKNLLEVLGMEKHLIKKNSLFPSFEQSLVNYEEVNEKLDKLRKESENYLTHALEGS